MADDRDGYLEAFGVPVRIKGGEYVGILDDDYEGAELGPMRVDTNSISVVFKTPDVTAMALVRGDALTVWNPDSSTWSAYSASSIQARTDGFTMVRLIEAA